MEMEGNIFPLLFIDFGPKKSPNDRIRNSGDSLKERTESRGATGPPRRGFDVRKVAIL
jgi:hypothetical protein